MDIKDLKNLLTEKVKGVLNKKKTETVQTNEPDSAATSSSPSTEPAGGGRSKRLKALTFVAIVVIFFVVGSVLAYNYYFFSEKGTPQELTLSRPYQPPTPANAPVAANSGDDDVVATGQNIQEDKQAQKGTNTSVPPNEGRQVVQNESSPAGQSPAKKGAMRVSEHDPFKSEFEKKYQAALKKEKGLSGSLSDLEGSIKEAKLNLPPTPPLPPPPPAPKQLKLAVFGTVISPNDTYAITDMGVIRVGNVVESFTVESIKFDMVILRQNDNKDEVRNIFVKARGRQADGIGGAMPIHAGGQQWPSSQ